MMMARLGWAGWLGTALAAAALALYFNGVRPAEARLVRLQTQASKALLLSRTALAGKAGAQSGLDAFYAYFPTSRSVPSQLQRVFDAAAAQSLQLAQAEYSFMREPGTRLASYRIELPVRGSYARIRGFSLQVLREVPAMALDEISFRREEISGETLESKIRFTLYLRAE